MSFNSKEQRSHVKSRKPLTSSTNTRDSESRKQKSYSKKQNLSSLFTQSSSIINRSITGKKYVQQKHEKEEFQKTKQTFLDGRYYEKYYKKEKREEFPNISIIEEKESIMSINQENSLDSLNNFIIHGHKHESSLMEKSRQSSEEEGVQDWTLLQKEYIGLRDRNQRYEQHQNSFEGEYLQVLNELTYKKGERTQQINQPLEEYLSPILKVTQKIRTLQQEINKLKLQNVKKNPNQSSSSVLQNIGASQSYNQQKSSIYIEKSQNSNEILRKSSTTLQREESLQLPSNISKLRIRVSDDSNKKNHTSDRLLEHLSEEENKEFIEEQSPQAQDQETEKDQEEFMEYMDKKQLEDNQPNLSLNNISKIMGVKAKEPHNKSIENENEIKEKDDDEVVAMLENQLRGKQIVEIPEIEETQNLLKESRDNLCLNDLEGDTQNNIQTSLIQQEPTDQSKKNFFIALEAREKWIMSLEKDEKWKKAELALLSKMKKILHNPYIEFPEF